MAWQIWIEYAGATYHLMAWETTVRRFMETTRIAKSARKALGQVCEKTGWWVPAYAHVSFLTVDTF